MLRPPDERRPITWAPSGPGSESLAGQEDERRELAIMADRERIASDLHDLVIQRLFAAGLALQSTAKITVDPQIARRLDHVIDELDAAIVDIRSSIFALGHRCKSTSGDLRGQILDLVADAARTLGHDPSMRFYGPVATAVPDVVADHLIAVLREALSNVARHAHATKTTINLHTTAQLSDALGAALRRGAMGLVCDLSGVSFFGAAGVTTLLMGRQRAIACHAWFDLVCPQPFPREVIALVGLDAVFNVYDRLAEAVNAQARHVDRPGLTTTPQTSDILPSCSPGVGSGDSKQQ